jgi:ferredoxin-NADP reductase/CRP-like cAMP-binding protein
MSALLRSGLFDGLPDATLEAVAGEAMRVGVAAGCAVVTEGDPGDCFFVVVRGRLRVHTTAPDGELVELDQIGPGEHFGEQALLRSGPRRRRSASVSAREATELLRMEAGVLDALMAADPALRGRLDGLGRGYLDRRLAARSSLVRGLRATAPHTLRDVAPGEVIAAAGATACQSFVVVIGAVVLHEQRGETLTRVARLGPGLSFGNDGTHAHTVIAEVQSRLLVVPHGALETVRSGRVDVQAQLAAVSRAWALPRRGFVTQIVGEQDGVACIDQHYSLLDGRTVIANQFVGDDGLRVETVDVPVVDTVASPDGRLRLLAGPEGRVCGLVAHGRALDVAAAVGLVLDAAPLTADTRRVVQETGRLQAVPESLACACLRVPLSSARAILEHGDVALLQRRTGAGTVCGTCLPSLRVLAGERALLPVRIDRLERPTPDVIRVVLRHRDGGHLPPALVGQHVVLRVTIGGEAVDRIYTLCSAPGEPWEVLVKVLPGGAFSGWLRDWARVGTALEASEPTGHCVWDGGPAPVLAFVAGIGVTPALAIARTLVAEGWPHRVVVDWSTREVGDRALLGGLAVAGVPNLDLRVRVTGRGGRLQQDDVVSWVRRFPSAVAFVCGPEAYQHSVRGWLRGAGLADARIHAESFVSGAPQVRGAHGHHEPVTG